ncbi:LysR family transcriptional regulator [Actinomadura sp. LD22]|uniref:LysR family transcriptional regulator n=1 Tax=Actinomadura physcomitrii TaxID=2650748 RepID=A0A6I4M6Z1_9ACTN|nr:LysR family transcriptional regulator [Actinomadura physcomitrii]MVZ99926.1 LysR family transcriptional regulator [Actinomadura physcomitrii]
MELHQIRYFLAVVDNQGLGIAAGALGVAQPTVSQAVRELERDLGVELFHRLGRGMVLSSAGRALVGPARRILRDVAAAEGALVDAAGQLRGRLDIAVMPSLAVDPVARMVSAFRHAHPSVSVRIGSVESAEAGLALIKQGDYELVACYLPLSGDAAGLTVEPVGVQEYCVVMPPGTELPPDDPLPLSALPGLPLIAVRRQDSRTSQIEQAVAAAGALRRAAALVESPHARLPFVLAGVGGSFLPRAVAEDAISQGLVVRAVTPPFSWRYGLVFDAAALSNAGRAFVAVATSAPEFNARDTHECPRGG